MGSKESKPSENDKREADPDFSGPLNQRSCTDVICCGIFALNILLYGVVGIVGFYYGNPARLLHPTDSEGNSCGSANDDTITGRDLSDKPFLHMFDISKCTAIGTNFALTGEIACPTTSVCVKECPDSNWAGFLDIARYEAAESIDYTKYICEYDISAGTGSGQISNPKDLIVGLEGGDGVCGSYYFKEEPLLKRCIPSILSDVFDTTTEVLVQDLGPVSSSGDSVDAVTGQTMEAVGKVLEVYYEAQGIAMQVLDDLVDSYVMLIVFMIVSCVLVFIFIAVMRLIAWLVVWTLLLTVHVALGAATYYCYMKYVELKADETVAEDPNNYNIKANLDYYSGLYETWMYTGIVCASLLGIILLMTCFLCNRIRLAIRVIGEASRAVRSMPLSFMFPLIPWIAQSIVLVYFLLLTVYVASYEGDPVYRVATNASNESSSDDGAGSKCDPTVIYENITDSVSGNTQRIATTGNCFFQEFVGSEYISAVHAYNLFMSLWLINFIIALGQCTLAGGFAGWYWTRGEPGALPVIKSYYRCLRYHMGSLAFGSFIIAVIQIIRMILEYLDHKYKDKKGMIATFVMKCLRCCFWCFEKFIKFINKNAYIVIAIYGKNFCISAMDAFFLILRNAARVAILNGITAFLLFTCKLAITALMGFLAFLFFSGQVTQVEEWVPDLNYYFIPIIVVVVGTYIVATIFFDVYDMAVDTIFFCVLEDLERHDGSPEKPYFMSKDLQSLLGKKNDFSEDGKSHKVSAEQKMPEIELSEH
ncbi:choline transporter-like protein 2 isoform X1 [Convolutriloba macropyga]|uniref:choline transporter-like protein 2 isoform X1 n=1 Tax=Convolutriloba macropyga TaxID=536237 RepID=UPI003F528115